MAAANTSKECLELLLSHGAEVNVQNHVSNNIDKIKMKCLFFVMS